jgi:hypothetical protein
MHDRPLDGVGDRVDLGIRHRSLVGGAGQPAAQLCAIERLAAVVSLADEQQSLVALAGGEAMPAGRAFTAAPDRGAGIGAATLEHSGGGFAKGAVHTPNSTGYGVKTLLEKLQTLHIAAGNPHLAANHRLLTHRGPVRR